MVYKTSQGMVCWTEIPARDVLKVFNFYNSAFPAWEYPDGEPKARPDGKFDVVRVKFAPKISPDLTGGIVQMPEEINKVNQNAKQAMGVGHTSYFYVNSIDEAIPRLEKLGAKLVLPKMAENENGWYANLLDVEGNRFGLYELNTKRIPSEAVDAE